MIIAEIGLNHLGSKEYLSDYLKCLLNSSVDAITLQIREKEFYLKTQFENLRLPLETYHEVANKVKNSGKKFGMAISDPTYLSLLDDKVDFYKILSKDIDDKKIINELVNKIDKPMFASTGMASFETIASFLEMTKVDKRKNISLIHTRLSNKVEDTNLKAIQVMKKSFNFPIAFGNHCKNAIIIYAALAYEPSDVFFYVKGGKNVAHPDEEHAILLKDVEKYCKNIKPVEQSLGSGKKEQTKNIIKGQK